ncbi:MAG: site-specific integrase [Bacteroidetes bacterium]|nr:site-specific integrase [Bacteroidota bacterium]
MSQVKLIATEIWTKLIYENPKVSLQEYKEVLKENIQTPVTKQISQSSKSTIFEYLFQFIESISNERSISTIEKYKNLHRLLLTYSDRLTFENIDLSFFDSIKSHWLKENSLSNTTINKNIKLLKTFLSWAFDRKITDNDEFKRFKPMKQHDLNIVALTKAEFDAIYELKIMSSHLARVRDVFCFACLTGQRWSDIYKIDRDEIIDSTWSITQEKSKKKIRVPLLPQALAILKKIQR